jgi:alanine racemase
MEKFWCEIDLNQIKKNIEHISDITDKKLIAVVKANAYGLGIEVVSKFIYKYVDFFAVDSLEEAGRVFGDKDILLLNSLIDEDRLSNLEENIMLTIDNEEFLYKLDTKRSYKVQIYVDTGMNRMGIKPKKVTKLIQKIEDGFPNVRIYGIYTHLNCTKNKKYTIRQIQKFKAITEPYKDKIDFIHCLNSNGVLNQDYCREAQFTNCIRIGNLIYGYTGESYGFERVYECKAEVVKICKIGKGEFVGYGNRYKTKREMDIGIIKLGYIDNFGTVIDMNKNWIYNIAKVLYRVFIKKYYIYLNGRGVEIIGGVNMSNTLIHINNIKAGNIVTVSISPIQLDSSVMRNYVF